MVAHLVRLKLALLRNTFRRSRAQSIGAVLGIRPGPVLGRAYAYLLEVRKNDGPIGPEAARERLLAWWADQPESQP